MVDESRQGTYETSLQDRSGMAAGAIVGTAVAAGLIAFMIRRSREEKRTPQSRVASLASVLTDSDTAEMGRDFFMEKILPELKPALLAVLGELEDAVSGGFRRAEKSIKKL
jgi:hypothetical protein